LELYLPQERPGAIRSITRLRLPSKVGRFQKNRVLKCSLGNEEFETLIHNDFDLKYELGHGYSAGDFQLCKE